MTWAGGDKPAAQARVERRKQLFTRAREEHEAAFAASSETFYERYTNDERERMALQSIAHSLNAQVALQLFDHEVSWNMEAD